MTTEDIRSNIEAARAGVAAAAESLSRAGEALSGARACLADLESQVEVALAAIDSLARSQQHAENAFDCTIEARRQLGDYLDQIGVGYRFTSTGQPRSMDTRPPDLEKSLDEALKKVRELLPTTPTASDGRSGESVLKYCEALAALAKVVAFIANPVSGSMSGALDHIARGLGRPMMTPVAESALAMAKKAADGSDPARIEDLVRADRIVAFVMGMESFTALRQLKLLAFLLRLAGVVFCFGERQSLDGCPCLPDLLSDVGTTIIEICDPGR